jgi:hypothetical protein
MVTSSENACALRIETRQDLGRIREVIDHQAGESPPLLAWAEPDPLYVDRLNRTGRRGDFVPLVLGAPPWPADLPLVEARLFWPKAALHLVARADGGCVWTRIEEGGADENRLLVTRSEFPVHVHGRGDLARFGLAPHAALEGLPLRAIEYRERGRLVAWRLTIANEEYRNA